MLDCCYVGENKGLLGTLDCSLKVLDVSQGIELASKDRAHTEAIRKVCAIDENVVVSGSWDRVLKAWDLRTMKNVASVNVGSKVFCMDTSGTKVVVGGSDKRVSIFEFNTGGSAFRKLQELEPAKYQLRTIACMADGTGWAQGSVEGRVSIETFAKDEKKKFTFKCHREPKQGLENIYPVRNCFLVICVKFNVACLQCVDRCTRS